MGSRLSRIRDVVVYGRQAEQTDLAEPVDGQAARRARLPVDLAPPYEHRAPNRRLLASTQSYPFDTLHPRAFAQGTP